LLFFICGNATVFSCAASLSQHFRDSIGIEAKRATSTEVNITMWAEDLNVTGGARKLMEGKFLYQESLKPHADYKKIAKKVC
jgi:hypothetical protein